MRSKLIIFDDRPCIGSSHPAFSSRPSESGLRELQKRGQISGLAGGHPRNVGTRGIVVQMRLLQMAALVALFAAALSPNKVVAQTAIAEPTSIEGKWVYWTNPNDEKHRWSGSFTLRDVNTRTGTFKGTQDPPGGEIEGTFSNSGDLVWTLTLQGLKDSTGNTLQGWRAKLGYDIVKGKTILVMCGKWGGAFANDLDNKGTDFEFKAANYLRTVEGPNANQLLPDLQTCP